jgi:hypothetical protein
MRHGMVGAWVRTLVDEAGVIIKPLTPEVAAFATQFPADFPRDLLRIGSSPPQLGRKARCWSPGTSASALAPG